MGRCSDRVRRLVWCALSAFLVVLWCHATAFAETGRWKQQGDQCLFDENDSGPDQCTPGSGGGGGDGRWRLQSGMCMWEANSALADQCTPGVGIGRWKTHGSACYWEPGAVAPNQCVPNGQGSGGGGSQSWRLPAGGRLEPGAFLESPSHRYRFTNTPNGTLEIKEHDSVIWARGPFGTGVLEMQSADGNLVFTVTGTPVWASNTPGHPGAYLDLQNDGNLVVYSATGPKWASDTAAPPAPPGYLLAGGEIASGWEIASENGQYRLRNESNGTLVLYDGTTPLWASSAGPAGPVHMQYDGNLVLYRTGASPWHTQTSGHPGAYLHLTNGGHLAVKSPSGSVLWEATPGPSEPPLTPRVTINGISDPSGSIVVRPGDTLSVDVDGVLPNAGYTAGLFPENGCCDPPDQLEWYFVTQRPQHLTFTVPANVGVYSVSLVYCCPSPPPQASAEQEVVRGPRVKVLGARYLTVNGQVEGETAIVRPNHPFTVQVRNAAQGTDRVAWFRLLDNGQLGPLFVSTPIGGDLNAALPYAAPDAPASGSFALRLTSASGQVIGEGPTLYVPGNKLPLKPDWSSTDLYDDFESVPTENVRVTVHDIGATQDDWLGLFRVDEPDTGIVTERQNLTGLPSVQGNSYGIYYRFFTMPPQGGDYEVRLFAGDTGIRIARSHRIHVVGPEATAPTLTINGHGFGGDPVPVGVSAPLNVVVTGNPLYASDRVEIWPVGSDVPAVPPRYLNGDTSPPGVPPTSGTFAMTGPATPGLYSTVVVRSGAIAAFGPEVSVSATTTLGVDTPYYYSTDAVGSVRLITTAAGAEAARKDYLPFGSEWNATSTAQGDRVAFVGKERDPETGLDYFGARYASKDLGRFTTVDPGHVGGDIYDPQSWNAYAYARNNPLKYTDPTGTEYEICVEGAPSCQRVSDQRFADLQQNPGAGIQLFGGYIYAGERGVGTYRQTSIDWTFNDFFRQTGERADAMLKAGATEMAKNAVITAATFGVALAARASVEVVLASRSSVVFKTGHYASRLLAAGVNVDRAEATVQGLIKSGAPLHGTVRVDGALLEYRAMRLPDGRINVGTIFPQR